jgi:phage terminase small subunit
VQCKVLYEITHNAHRSALIAGYSPKTAKSKAYLLARQVAGM